MIDKILNILNSDGCTLEESIMSDTTRRPFWHCSVIDSNRHPVSGGFNEDRMQARKVAIAEYLERRKFHELSRSSDAVRTAWGFNIIPTACGYAVGFDKTNTVIRSIQEAIERWVMSKWIDDRLCIPELRISDILLDEASSFLVKQFDSVLFFKKGVLVPFNNGVLKVNVCQTMGLSKGGIFPGSSAQDTGGNLWQHALVESYRHLLAVRNNPDRGDMFPDNRVRYFSTHADEALEQIHQANGTNWPTPEIIFHRTESFEDGQYFLARTILNGWKNWNSGPINRFLY